MNRMELRGQRLRECREARGLSSAEVADQIGGITAGSILRYERGEFEPSNDVLIKLARLYAVSTDFLLTGDSVSSA